MKPTFSAKSRIEILKSMAQQELDVLVIGGGITGGGIALDAVTRGMRIGLIEKNDFGSGTSSRSTKLIHGGLRYLKQGDVKLVQEVGKERAILYKNAPHLVIPAPMLLPVYKGGTYGYLASSIGLYIYDWLAGVARKERRKMLGRNQTALQEPLLKQDGLKGGGLYFEYRTDDARLTIDIMKTAHARGAQIVNYAEATEFIYRDGKVVGVEVTDRINGQTFQIYAKHIVNAAGPWVDKMRQIDGSLKGKRLFLTKGVHLVVDYEKLPVKQAAYFDTPDGRMVFVIPRGKSTYVGTTDTAFEKSIDNPRATKEDRDYIIRAVNAMFPSVQLTIDDIRSHWAGLRPLIYEEGKGPSELSRKDEIFVSDSGLITIAGGKLTGFRKMAEKVTDLVAQHLERAEGRKFPACSTDAITISGGENSGASNFQEWKKEMLRIGKTQGVDRSTMQEWIDTYGTNALQILEYLPVAKQVTPNLELQFVHAQLLYAMEAEMTVTAADFLRLHTGWSYFQLEKAEKYADIVLQMLSSSLSYNTDQKQKQIAMVESLFQSIYELPANDHAI
ncbi:Aerobic glycerol-3-phosphate dehydrogenase [Paenibacillus allorhizoplanae]|uniref:Aerobic glycerol-3-phosphate dehydrogenase n=1 Tax=Paenibacillus allorhizoplanae TaxID=2905648 RepID=A0ABM9CTN1_9BACL|nr:glycerol-3-phosphate dehydrogenase/oxidase [Paenibacillus allorhizoplanae]CAH1224088.1 Aerobic glycerol-3-phosphate dehydrogenase [Paenibacillus allorhizoplanae]